MAAGKTKRPRTTKTAGGTQKGRAPPEDEASGSSAGAAATDEGPAALKRRPSSRDAHAPEPVAGRTIGIVVTVTAAVVFVAGLAILAAAVFALDNLNPQGTYTIDQQVRMAVAGVTAGAVLAAAGLLTLGLNHVGFALRGRG